MPRRSSAAGLRPSRWSTRPARRRARAAAVLAVAAPLVIVGTLTAGPALAAGSVVVAPTDDLDPVGETITVAGSGFNEEQGIYVSVCMDNGPGQLPTPCLGGVDTTGTTGSSAWVSSNPPPYAEGLTIPYGPGGSFDVTIFAVGADPESGIDCTVAACSLVTRSDHTATDDRSQDTRTPLTFRAAGASPSIESSSPTTMPATTSPAAPRPADVTPAAPSTSAAPTAEAAGGPAVPTPVWLGGALAAAAAAALVLRSRRTEKGTSQ